MNRERIDQIAKDVWSYVFTTLDEEPDLGGDDCGSIATAAERAVREALSSIVTGD